MHLGAPRVRVWLAYCVRSEDALAKFSRFDGRSLYSHKLVPVSVNGACELAWV